MRRLFMITAMVLLVACGKSDPEFYRGVDIVTEHNALLMHKKCNLRLDGSGGALKHGVKWLGFDYTGYQHLNIDEARRLYIEGTGALLHEMNSHPLVKPYLLVETATINELRYMIGFMDNNGLHVSDGSVALVTAIDDVVHYSTYNLEKDRLETLHTEPYDEAVQIVADSYSLECEGLPSLSL